MTTNLPNTNSKLYSVYLAKYIVIGGLKSTPNACTTNILH